MAFAAAGLAAALELGAPFTDGVVLQRGKPVKLWGRASAGAAVTVEFAGKSYSTTAVGNGEWRLAMPPMEAISEPQVLRVSESAYPGAAPAGTVEVKDVLVGEVWIFSGQSNMECPIWGDNPRFRDGNGAIAVSHYAPSARALRQKRTQRGSPGRFQSCLAKVRAGKL